MPKAKAKTIRRSVALPSELMDDLLSVAPAELKANLNRLVVFLCFQVRSLDPSRLKHPAAGQLPPSRMVDVNRALRLTLEL